MMTSATRNQDCSVGRQPGAGVLSRNVIQVKSQGFRSPGLTSQEGASQGFLPAFLDTGTGAVYLSRFADGRLAPVHVLEGLPLNFVLSRTPSGRVAAAVESLVAGFVRRGRFYTRLQAAQEVQSGL